MSRRVYITGVGPISALGIGIQPTWDKLTAAESALAPIEAFDPAGFECQIGGEVETFKIRDYVPKTYRKATKVMARDIELAVAAADQAARDAGLVTTGTQEKGDDTPLSYPSDRIGAHIGAGLIAADLDELTAALARSTGESGVDADATSGGFDIHHWGAEGMENLTPLWLLKYLPNMLACHVTIIHDTQGPSNTITCGEASSGLSIGESLRVIQRDQADLCFCGGAEYKLNPMGYLRMQFTERLSKEANDTPTTGIRPFDQNATGQAIGEGGGIVVLEAAETYDQRGGDKKAYAEVVGFAATQTVNREKRNLQPNADGRSIAAAIQNALREGGIDPSEVDLLVPYGSGTPAWDQAECAAMKTVFGDRLQDIAVLPVKAYAGNTCAGAGGLDVAIAAKCLAEQTVPAIINRDTPLEGMGGSTATTQTKLRHAVVFSAGFGGQNTALVLKAV